MQSWEKTVVHFIDFEGSKTSGVVEYGIVALRNRQIDNVLTRLCAPTHPIPPIEYGIHGIKTQIAQNFPPFSDDFIVFKRLRKIGPFAAHNAASENSLIKEAWPYVGKVPSFFSPNTSQIDWGPWIDTLFIYQNLFPNLKDYKLMGLIRHFELKDTLTQLSQRLCPKNRQKAHCALYDALASALLFQKILQTPSCNHLLPKHFFFLSFPNSRLRWHDFSQERLPTL